MVPPLDLCLCTMMVSLLSTPSSQVCVVVEICLPGVYSSSMRRLHSAQLSASNAAAFPFFPVFFMITPCYL